MGCFMACFGLSNKRKRRTTFYKVLARNQKYGNYEALAITEKNSIVPCSDFRKREECKEQKSVKSKKKKKKVTFNLNVQIYEPDPTAYQVLDNEEEEEENENTTTTTEPEGSATLTMQYPPNYRYYNCNDEYDEEDEIGYEESDIDNYDDEDDDEFDDGYDCDDGGSDESFENDEDGAYDQNTRQKELSGSCYSVLKPVENLTQWKAIKAKVASSKNRRKENVVPSEEKTSMPFSPCSLESSVLQSKPVLPEIAVVASLSNWISSPNYNNVSMTKIHCQ